MKAVDIDKSFRTLGLDPSASFAEVKEARGWYSKAFHPDRFPTGSSDVAKAEEKQKEINLAFEELKRWFQAGSSQTRHHKRTSSEDTRRGSKKTPRWQAQLNSYAQLLQNSPKSPATIKNSYSDLRAFASWLTIQYGDALDLHATNLEQSVVDYALQLSEHGYKSSTIARHLYSIGGFLAYVGMDVGFVNPLISEYKSNVRPQVKSLTDKQLANFLQTIKHDAFDDDEALVLFILHTGVSASELCALRWKDLSSAKISKHRRKCVMMNVTGRTECRQIPLNDLAVNALKILGFNGILPIRGKLSDTNIFSRGDLAMTPKMVHYVVDRYAKIAHIAVTPSILRNTFCKKLAKSDVPLEHLAKLIGVNEQSAKVYYPPGAAANVDALFAAACCDSS